MSSRERWLAWVFVAPAPLLAAAPPSHPMVGTFIESLYSTSFINPKPKFEGLATYWKIVGDPSFGTVVWNSLVWTFFVVVLQNVTGFAAALLLNQRLPGQGLMRSLVLLP